MKLSDPNRYRHFSFLLALIISTCSLLAQHHVISYADLGSNSVSDGLYFKTSALGNFEFGKYSVEIGLQFDFKSKNENFLTGFDLSGSREFQIKNFNFSTEGFFKWTFYSGLIRISDWGLLARTDLRHFKAAIGTHFKTFSLTEEAIWYYDPASETKIHENWNILYLLGYNLKKRENNWNIGICMTNIDYFIISQTTNPSLNLNGSYRIKPELTLFAETWFKSSGAFNSNVNYFGLFLRAGIIWKINTNQ